MILLDTCALIFDALTPERLIAATARVHRTSLVTADRHFRDSDAVDTVW